MLAIRCIKTLVVQLSLLPSIHGEIVVLTLELLLLWIGSGGEVAVTIAVLVIVPFVVGFTEMLMVAVPVGGGLPAVGGRSPRLHTSIRFSGLSAQLPWLGDADPKPAFFGS